MITTTTNCDISNVEGDKTDKPDARVPELAEPLARAMRSMPMEARVALWEALREMDDSETASVLRFATAAAMNPFAAG